MNQDVKRLVIAGVIAAAVAGLATADDFEIDSPLSGTIGGDFGKSITAVADIDGDGLDDVLVGSGEFYSGGGGVESGRAYIMSARSGATLRWHEPPVNPSDPDGDWLGYGSGVARVPDTNGDGVDDYIIGASEANPGGYPYQRGVVYLYSGATGILLHSIEGYQSNVYFGAHNTIDGVDDVDGDGRGDIVIGRTGPFFHDGPVRLYSGATGSLIRVINVPAAYSGNSYFGDAVVGLGDVNNDGRGDIAVGAHEAFYSGSNLGAVFIFSGATGALLSTIESPELNSNYDLGWFGYSLGRVPDVNGDGRDDLVVGAPYQEYEQSGPDLAAAGKAYLFSGYNGSLLKTIESPNPEEEGRFGFSVAGCGNTQYTGGTGHVLVGAPDEAEPCSPDCSGPGRAYIFDGASGALVSTANSNGSFGSLGARVAGLGDINGNGRADAAFCDPDGGSGGDGYVRILRWLDHNWCAIGVTEVFDGYTDFTTIGALTWGGEEATCGFCCGDNQINSDVWYHYTATCTGTLRVSTCGTVDYDSKIGIYNSCNINSSFPWFCSSASILACNDDASGCPSYNSEVELEVTAGTCYRIRIGGYLNSQGYGSFLVQCGVCDQDLDGNSIVDGADLTILLAAWGTNDPAADLDGNGIVDGADLTTLLAAWGPC